LSKQLWIEVLATGLVDAAQGVDEDWIGSPDFRFVCDQAGMTPEAVAFRFWQHRDDLKRALGYRTRSNGPKRRAG